MYDRREVYDKHIKRKAKELHELCKSLGVATFMSFCVFGDGDESDYKNFVNGTTSNGIHLNDDRIIKHINVENGFMTVPPDRRLDDVSEGDFDM